MIRPWAPGDTERIELQPAQRYMTRFIDASTDLSHLADQGLAWTAEEDGRIIAIGGLIEEWAGRATAWTLISEHAGCRMPAIHRAVKRFLDAAPYRRIEAHVDVGFAEGVRWMRMLGFEMEGYMRAFRPDGEDMLLFARVRDERI